MAKEIPHEIKTLREIKDQLEKNAELLVVMTNSFQELLTELQSVEDEQQLLADFEASPDEADKAALRHKTSDLQERREKLTGEISHSRNELETLAAQTKNLRTRVHEEVEKLHAAGIETQKMHFEIAKHLTTLNTAAILVYLAAGEEVSLPLWVALLFVLSLAGAAVSMIATGLRWISPSPSKIGNLAMSVAVAGFLVGLLYSVLHAILLP